MSACPTNFLQPSNFKVAIDRVNLPNIEFLINVAQHPSVTMDATTNVSRPRIQNYPFPGEALQFAEVSFEMMLDEDMAAYREIFDWMKRVAKNVYTLPTKETDVLLSSEEDIRLLIYTSANVLGRTITYKNAFPTNLGDIAFNANVASTEVLSVNVSFAYSEFEIT